MNLVLAITSDTQIKASKHLDFEDFPLLLCLELWDYYVDELPVAHRRTEVPPAC